MALIDDLSEPTSEKELSRRRMLLTLGGGALVVAGLGTLATSVDFMRPKVLFEKATKFAVGRADSLPPGGVLDLKNRKVFVVHGPRGFYAMSSICTHLGCVVKHQGPGRKKEAFFCPCHGSRFDIEGSVLGGPAPRPLDRLELALDGGKLVVDTKSIVQPGTVLES